MKAALAIVAAEIRQHRLVFWIGPLVGLLPLVLNYALEGGPLRAVPRGYESEGTFFVWVFAIVFSFAVAVGLGSTVVSRDLESRRLGFWLSRPQPLLQYWAGKMGAAYLLAVCAFILVALPAHLLGSMSWANTGAAFVKGVVGGRVWQVWLGTLAVALAAGSAAGGALRSRAGLLILDILMAPIVWAAFWFGALSSVFEAGTDAVVMLYAMPWLMLGTVPVLLAAGAAQVCVGRLELRRGHALLSAITWGGLLVFFVGGILASSRYVLSATPADLRLPYASFSAPRSGDHVMIESISTTWNYLYRPGFLLGAQGGFVRIGGVAGGDGVGWSRDGRVFAWSREAPFRPAGDPKAGRPPFSRGPGLEPTLHVHNLDRPGSAPRRLTGDVEYDSALRAVSPSGQRLLVESSTRMQVLDAEAGRKLMSLDTHDRWLRAAFLSESTIRALRINARETNLVQQATVVDWDLASGRLTERGTIKGGGPSYAGLTPTEDWQRLLRLDGSGLTLHDLDGGVAATLVDRWADRTNRAAGLLSGGRVGCVEGEASILRLRVFDSEGRVVSEARLKGRFPLRVGGEIAPGLLALGVSDDGEPATLIVDLLTGSVVRRERGLSPALRLWEAGKGLYTATPEPGSLGTRLFLGSDGVVSLDPASGARTVLIARSSRIAEK